MTEEQAQAAKEIREIAEKNNLVVSAIWCANDVLEYYNNELDGNKDELTYDEAEDILLGWQKQLEDNAVENGYRVIEIALQSEDLEDED